MTKTPVDQLRPADGTPGPAPLHLNALVRCSADKIVTAVIFNLSSDGAKSAFATSCRWAKSLN
jgi:hypothetical protein